MTNGGRAFSFRCLLERRELDHGIGGQVLFNMRGKGVQSVAPTAP